MWDGGPCEEHDGAAHFRVDSAARSGTMPSMRFAAQDGSFVVVVMHAMYPRRCDGRSNAIGTSIPRARIEGDGERAGHCVRLERLGPKD